MIRRTVVVAGARPNFPKVGPLLAAFARRGVEAQLVHTGQHYDDALSASFFEALDIPPPSINLGVGSGSHAEQTAAVLVAFERWLEGEDADAVLVVGDVNSTVACALVAGKLGLPVGHVEAGLRSFDRSMPEELNRVVVDALSTWLFTPSADADANLAAEGVDPARVHLVGNIMVDALRIAMDRTDPAEVRARYGLPERYGVITLHRPALVDSIDTLAPVVAALRTVADALPLVFPVHPRTRPTLAALGVGDDDDAIRLVPPAGYLDFLGLEAGASLVLTDSGGIQEETTALGVPCLTLRENTERPITVTRGTNRLVGLEPAEIVLAGKEALSAAGRPAALPFWDGHTADRIVDVLCGPAVPNRWIPPSLLTSPSPELAAGRRGRL